MKSVKLIDLAKIFMLKLGLSNLEAISFARFLVEEADESEMEEKEVQKVEYNPQKKINQQLVCCRLQTNSTYPIIYSDHHEKEAFTKIMQVFKDQRNYVHN